MALFSLSKCPRVVASAASEKTPVSTKKPAQRFDFIDWFRGLACVLMIQTHAYDSWTAEPYRKGFWWWFARMQLGGFPARMFLILAGVSLMLRFSSDERRGVPIAQARRGAFMRGLEVLGLGLLFRVVEWCLGGFGAEGAYHMLRVDVLNCIGLSLMICAYVASPRDVQPGRWPVVPAVLALLIASLTPLVQKLGRPPLPEFLGAYLYGPHPLASFSLLPWLAYTLTGCAVGALWVQASRADAAAAAAAPENTPPASRHFNRVMVVTAIAGAILALGGQLGYQLQWPIYYPTKAVPELASPVSYFYRTGMCLIGVACAYWLSHALPRRPGRFSPLHVMGQASMLVYVVHIEIVYGRLTWPIRHRLQPITATVLIVLLTALMTALAWYRLNRWPARYAAWRARRAAASAQPA